MKPRSRARRRLLCVPYAGVGPSAYRQWGEALPADIEVGVVHLPGREGRLREAPFTRIEPLIDAATEALRPYLDLPFAMFGHSMGALVAFELARRFRDDRGITPTHLFVSGRRAPQLPARHPAITHLPDDEFVKEIRRRYNGIPDEVLRHPDLLALLLPGLRADLSVIEAYAHRPGSPLGCPIAAFGGLADPEATEAELVGWRQQTTGALSVRMFPGGHFFVQSAHEELMRILTDELMVVTDQGSGPWS
ncbi:MAG TPA: alpha/beta fold hydrolase [Methylomirabilota bacterium]|nr:alpha/beta fold hydrolase [Methylomirabilota bacterium]